ncbi:Uncharacterised protein [BD1-7 clade bacterium]|uniref:Uncharacterized protein n=1 Tax=BD1-7 clade bacterium TaxID=2029982 RepID=A0A5S9QWJ2_9GAMM|nr:Uncharacterised protein [BD1-7 clade bacterium]
MDIDQAPSNIKKNSDDLSSGVLSACRSSIVTYLSATRFIFSLDRVSYLATVVYLLMSSFLVFLTSIIPIKIILLLPAQQALPGVVARWCPEKETFILFLCALSIVLIALTVFVKRLADRNINRKLRKIEASAQIFSRFKKRKKIRQEIKNNFSITTGMISTVIYMGVLLVVYPELSVFLLSFACTLAVVLLLLQRCKVLDIPTIKSNQLKQSLAKAVLMSAVFFTVYDNVFSVSTHDHLVIILGIIMVRQISGSFLNVFGGLVSIRKSTLIRDDSTGEKTA